ncbi:MAG: SDR family NAD(P)-dependent oxidoreductase [Acidimicrobiales bacterium]
MSREGGVLSGRRAIVTGAGRGIGLATAMVIAARGAAVVVNDIDGDAAEAAVAAIISQGGRAVASGADVSSPDGGREVVELARRELGGVDALVNNAGILVKEPLEELSEATVSDLWETNVGATLWPTHAAFLAMREGGGGRIVNTTSKAGLDGIYPGLTAYSATKAAIYAITRVTAVEGEQHGILCNAVAPYAVSRMLPAERLEPQEAAELDPVRVAEVTAFLVGPEADGITGRVIRVEGRSLSESRMVTESLGLTTSGWEPAALRDLLVGDPGAGSEADGACGR